uniref:Acid sphingomyelinase-like phosphodiesterase 3b n=1 Tax=Hirondellea gigas TaxID=1518452 RepID=A0A2P2HZX6_9CRUS
MVPLCRISLSVLLLVCYAWAAAVTSTLEGTGTFWQVTDIHWDTRYSLSGDDTNMCHAAAAKRAAAVPDGNTIRGSNGAVSANQNIHEDLRQKRLMEDQVSASGSSSNGRFGNYLCDSPWLLVRASLDAMQQLHSSPDFVLWTGDMGPHVKDPEPHFPIILSTLKNVTGELKNRFPDIAILPVLGNHDTYPKGDFPDCPVDFFARYLTEGGWETVLDEQQRETFKLGGYYLYTSASGLRVAILNTNMYYMFNHIGTGDADPCGQFAWLTEQLQQAKADNVKVLLSAHSPPGFFERMPIIPFFNASYNKAYLSLLAQHSDAVHSHVYGHLHTDTFRIFAGEDGLSSGSVAFIAPSVTPWQGGKIYGGTSINPSVRLYSYDELSVVDYVQYHLNLTRANIHDDFSDAADAFILAPDYDDDDEQHRSLLKTRHGQKIASSLADDGSVIEGDDNGSETAIAGEKLPGLESLHWEVYYEARKAYSLDRLDTSNMNKLLGKLTDDQALFEQYYERNSAGVLDDACSGRCRRGHLCSIQCLKIRDLFSCMKFDKPTYAALLNQTFSQFSADDYAEYFLDSNDKESDNYTTAVVVGSNNNTSDNISHSASSNTSSPFIVTEATTNFSSNITNNISSINNSDSSINSTINGTIISGNSTINTNSSSFFNDTYSSIFGNGDSDDSMLSTPVILMIGFVCLLWVAIGVLYSWIRCRRRRRYGDYTAGESADALLTARRNSGYSLIGSQDQQND